MSSIFLLYSWFYLFVWISSCDEVTSNRIFRHCSNLWMWLVPLHMISYDGSIFSGGYLNYFFIHFFLAYHGFVLMLLLLWICWFAFVDCLNCYLTFIRELSLIPFLYQTHFFVCFHNMYHTLFGDERLPWYYFSVCIIIFCYYDRQIGYLFVRIDIHDSSSEYDILMICIWKQRLLNFEVSGVIQLSIYCKMCPFSLVWTNLLKWLDNYPSAGLPYG